MSVSTVWHNTTFCIDLRTNSEYFPIQHKVTSFYNRDLTLYSPVVTICNTSLTFNNSTFSPHSLFMFFQWNWEQRAIVSLYSIIWLDFITGFNTLKFSVHYIYHQLNIQQAYVQPTKCINVFCDISEGKQRLFQYTA